MLGSQAIFNTLYNFKTSILKSSYCLMKFCQQWAFKINLVIFEKNVFAF